MCMWYVVCMGGERVCLYVCRQGREERVIFKSKIKPSSVVNFFLSNSLETSSCWCFVRTILKISVSFRGFSRLSLLQKGSVKKKSVQVKMSNASNKFI